MFFLVTFSYQLLWLSLHDHNNLMGQASLLSVYTIMTTEEIIKYKFNSFWSLFETTLPIYYYIHIQPYLHLYAYAALDCFLARIVNGCVFLRSKILKFIWMMEDVIRTFAVLSVDTRISLQKRWKLCNLLRFNWITTATIYLF